MPPTTLKALVSGSFCPRGRGLPQNVSRGRRAREKPEGWTCPGRGQEQGPGGDQVEARANDLRWLQAAAQPGTIEQSSEPPSARAAARNALFLTSGESEI